MEGKHFKLSILGIWKCAFGKKGKETFAVPSIYLQKKVRVDWDIGLGRKDFASLLENPYVSPGHQSSHMTYFYVLKITMVRTRYQIICE